MRSVQSGYDARWSMVTVVVAIMGRRKRRLRLGFLTRWMLSLSIEIFRVMDEVCREVASVQVAASPEES
jgi:hypothetical protein